MAHKIHGCLARLGVVWAVALGAGCRSPEAHRRAADAAAARWIGAWRSTQATNAVPFAIERPSERFRQRLLAMQELPTTLRERLERPAPTVPTDAVRLNLAECLRLAAENSREWQQAREEVFLAALDLDLEHDAFRTSFAGLLGAEYSDQRAGETPRRGVSASAEGGATQTLRSGAKLGVKLAADLAKMLTGDRDAVRGLLADVSLSVPMMRGAGRAIVREPLTQAERNLAYAALRLERFRRTLAVEVARSYFGVLEQMVQVRNQEENLNGIAMATRRAEELGRAGRIPEIQVNLSRQNELTARDRLAVSRVQIEARLDRFKVQLGLPADAAVELDEAELAALVSPASTEVAMPEAEAIRTALERRHDLRIARDKVEDAERAVRVAEDALRAGLTFTASASAGGRRSAAGEGADDADLRWDRGRYGAGLSLDLPWERTAERNAYRKGLVALDAARRAAEAAEDEVKSDVRSVYRSLRQAAQVCAIQEQAEALARRRVQSTEMMLEAGRAEMRDLVEARDALLQAQNSLVSARVAYRLAELEFHRALETLTIGEDGGMEDAHVARQ